ncbi:MAG: hypothetical protein HDQ95_11040 [Roseburia sp.]|nr:hypothetical protein [Roseburia sp.]
MKLLKKALRGIAIFAGLIIFVLLLYSGAKTFLKKDLFQDYLNVQGIENIIFVRNGWYQCYKRSFWGLEKYDYKNTGITDDEYCYYRVYEIETGKNITIYQAYRAWYNLFWFD